MSGVQTEFRQNWLVTVISGVQCSDGIGRLVSHSNLRCPVWTEMVDWLVTVIFGVRCSEGIGYCSFKIKKSKFKIKWSNLKLNNNKILQKTKLNTKIQN